MNNTDNETSWRWHRQDTKHKSHLVAWFNNPIVTYAACGWRTFVEEPNNNREAPCRNCLRSAAGRSVGRG